MPIDFYHSKASAPCRFVELVAAALHVPLNRKQVDLMAGEHMRPEYIKMNPQHNIPTIVDDGFVLWESRAIGRYLVNKYGGDSSLYPKDPQARAVIDQRLDFDIGTLYARFYQYFYPQVLEGKSADEGELKKLHEAFAMLNTFLEKNKYVAGEELTLADLSLVANVSTIDSVGISIAEYPNILRWFDLVKNTAPDYEEANGKGVQEYKEVIGKLRSLNSN
ncbi:Glutathione S-transferase 1, isoform D [Papilio xuthus]|uniref:Glutathione S-transferase 1, isoform D n=1 Tax=Papilio xuthus TaxID=66420 RepID=A0A194QG29_PAPXU|nr:Glutathione S-transferase 1, isoform D [Papilio xuthus]